MAARAAAQGWPSGGDDGTDMLDGNAVSLRWLQAQVHQDLSCIGKAFFILLHGSHVPCFNLALSVESRRFLTAEQEASLGHLQQDKPDKLSQVQATDHLLKHLLSRVERAEVQLPVELGANVLQGPIVSEGPHSVLMHILPSSPSTRSMLLTSSM